MNNCPVRPWHSSKWNSCNFYCTTTLAHNVLHWTFHNLRTSYCSVATDKPCNKSKARRKIKSTPRCHPVRNRKTRESLVSVWRQFQGNLAPSAREYQNTKIDHHRIGGSILKRLPRWYKIMGSLVCTSKWTQGVTKVLYKGTVNSSQNISFSNNHPQMGWHPMYPLPQSCMSIRGLIFYAPSRWGWYVWAMNSDQAKCECRSKKTTQVTNTTKLMQILYQFNPHSLYLEFQILNESFSF